MFNPNYYMNIALISYVDMQQSLCAAHTGKGIKTSIFIETVYKQKKTTLYSRKVSFITILHLVQ